MKEMPAQTQMLYARLGVDLNSEKKNTHDQLNSFVDKIHAFELQNIHKDGYVQFIHMIS